MYLCRELTDLSLPRIGQAFGGRDHTTVMHADRKIRQQMAERRSLYNQIAELTNRIKQTAVMTRTDDHTRLSQEVCTNNSLSTGCGQSLGTIAVDAGDNRCAIHAVG